SRSLCDWSSDVCSSDLDYNSSENYVVRSFQTVVWFVYPLTTIVPNYSAFRKWNRHLYQSASLGASISEKFESETAMNCIIPRNARLLGSSIVFPTRRIRLVDSLFRCCAFERKYGGRLPHQHLSFSGWRVCRYRPI